MGNILYFIALIFLVLWLVGYLGYAAGGFIHILLVIAFVALIIQIFQRRKT